MADNVTLNSMSGGAVVAADEIDGKYYQRVKLIHGADGTNDGDVASGNPLPVAGTVTANAGTNLNTSGLAVEAGGNLAAVRTALEIIDNFISGSRGLVTEDNSAAIKTAVELIDNAISGAGFNITQLGGANVPIGAGTEATAIRVTLPTNGTGIVGLATGSNAIGKLAANSGVDIGDTDVTSIVPGYGATNLGKREDDAHNSADVGVQLLAVRQATPANSSGSDGDYEPLKVFGGRLWVAANATLDAETTKVIGTVNLAAAQTLATVTTVGTVTTLTGGGVAHDGADSGNPVKVGGRCDLTPSTATIVADNDRSDLIQDGDGAQLVRSVTLGDMLSERVTNTDGASTALTTFGATASTRNYITLISVYNSSGTEGYVDIRDGTAGTVIHTIPLPAKGGAIVPFGGDAPLKQPTANTALAFDVSGALSTVYLSFVGFKSKV